MIARKEWLRLTLLGLVSGLVAATAVLLFRWTIEHGQGLFLPGGQFGNYESLEPWTRVLLPLSGGLILGWVFQRLPGHIHQVGVVHVLRMLRTPGGERLPLGNLLVQFLGGSWAIITGHSVDREGPAVHIGAASANLVGQGLGISREEDYTLAAAGAAAAIAASFNTPLAGIIFVIEVLRVRYDVTRYIPILTASVVGALVAHEFLGPDPAFSVPAFRLVSLREVPVLIALGLVTGLLAIALIALAEQLAFRTRDWRPSLSFPLAGLITGILAIWTPQIMGVSYDSLDALLRGTVELKLVLAIAVAKLVATAVAVGMRVPGGLIGPTLLIGGAAGSAAGILEGIWQPEYASSTSFYALIGMIAMMGATLRAPLAALTALLELTGNPNVILPGMIAVVIAELTNRLALGKESIFEAILAAQQRP